VGNLTTAPLETNVVAVHMFYGASHARTATLTDVDVPQVKAKKKINPAVMDVDRVSRRTTGTPASPPTESLLLPPGAENDDLFISKTTVTMVGGW